MSTGPDYSCLIKQGLNYVMCWSYNPNSFGVIDIPESVQFKAIKIQSSHHQSCVQTYNNTLECWGKVENQFDIEHQFRNGVKEFATGHDQVCVVNKLNNLKCQGNNKRGDLDIPDVINGDVKNVQTGYMTNCLIKESGQSICWNKDQENGYFMPFRNLFKSIDQIENIRMIKIGRDILGVTQDNKLVRLDIMTGIYFKHEENMEMYNFDTSQKILQIEQSIIPSTESKILDSVNLFCIIDFNRSLKCPNYNIPTVFTSEIICTSTHAQHSCLLTIEGAVHCFSNLKNETLQVPTKMILQNFTDISIGFNYRCQLTSVNYLVCNGVNTFGVLSAPPAWSESLTFIGTGMTSACTRDMRGVIHCWGSDQDGLLDIPGQRVAREVQVGNRHACQVSGQGKMWCWGANGYGQLDGEGVQRVGGGGGDGVGVGEGGDKVGGKQEREVSGKGEGGDVQIKMLEMGVNDNDKRLFTSLLKGGNKNKNKNKNKKEKEVTPRTTNQVVKALSTGGSHTCYLLSISTHLPTDQTTNPPKPPANMPSKLTCAGLNADGQCSVPPLALHSSQHVSAGQKHSCSVSHLGSVLCWGILNSQLSTEPAAFQEQFNAQTRKQHEQVIHVVAGLRHSCALTFKLNAYCWGSDKDGQVGIGSQLQSSQMVYGVYAGWNETIVIARDGSAVKYGKSTWDNSDKNRSLVG